MSLEIDRNNFDFKNIIVTKKKKKRFRSNQKQPFIRRKRSVNEM